MVQKLNNYAFLTLAVSGLRPYFGYYGAKAPTLAITELKLLLWPLANSQ